MISLDKVRNLYLRKFKMIWCSKFIYFKKLISTIVNLHVARSQKCSLSKTINIKCYWRTEVLFNLSIPFPYDHFITIKKKHKDEFTNWRIKKMLKMQMWTNIRKFQTGEKLSPTLEFKVKILRYSNSYKCNNNETGLRKTNNVPIMINAI